MGVMSCSRSGCKSIMCDTYVNDVGYVCEECQKEFKEYLTSSVLPEGEMLRELKKFMNTEKGSFLKGEDISVNQFFRAHTRD